MKYLLLFPLLWPITAPSQTRKALIGCWNMPGLKDEYLSLDSESSFFFNDYLEYRRAFEPLFGTWKLKGAVLILTYGEQKQIRFKVRENEAGRMTLFKPGSVRLFKARPDDCEKP